MIWYISLISNSLRFTFSVFLPLFSGSNNQIETEKYSFRRILLRDTWWTDAVCCSLFQMNKTKRNEMCGVHVSVCHVLCEKLRKSPNSLSAAAPIECDSIINCNLMWTQMTHFLHSTRNAIAIRFCNVQLWIFFLFFWWKVRACNKSRESFRASSTV